VGKKAPGRLDPLGGGGTPGAAEAPGGAYAEADRRRLCEEILADGFVQSFVDFFYLTHRPDPNAEPTPMVDGGAGREIEVPPEEMLYVRDNLTQAENARRQGDTTTVYGAYSNLAQHFQKVKDPKTGVYFYEKCLEISRLTGDKRGEMAANNDLGLIYQGMNDVNSAIKFHERHLELATDGEVPSEENVAAKELIKVYKKVAGTKEGANDHEEAVQYYQKCLEAARLAQEKRSEGMACYRLGRAYIMMEEPLRAISFLEDYEAICKELRDLEGEGQACAAIASAYQMLTNDEKAVEYLDKCLSIASETENLMAQGEANCALGVIHNKRGQYDKAVDCFERNFEIARSSVSGGHGDTSLVDISRVYLGMAKGNAILNQYLHVINHDIKALLVWKTRGTLHTADGAGGGGK